MRKLLLFTLALLLPLQAVAEVNPFFRAHGVTSVVLRNICAPDFTDPKVWFSTFDFDDPAELTIEIQALGDNVQNSYTYAGANIDNYDGTPPAWGDPPASAIEVEVDPNEPGCINLHVRDEVWDDVGATEWSISFIESTHDEIMAFGVQVNALADQDDAEAACTAANNAYDMPTNTEMEARTVVSASYATASGQSTTQADIAVVDANVDATLVDTAVIGVAGAGLTETSLSDAGVDAIWDEVMETAGDTYTARCILTIAQSQFAGTFSQLGNVRTYKDPSGATNRVVGTISGTTRSDITVTCP